MRKTGSFFKFIQWMKKEMDENCMGAYAAQAAFFFVVCLLPAMLLLMTLVQYTPVTREDVLKAMLTVFPRTAKSLITTVVNQVYSQSSRTITLTVLAALWSAGKGVMSISKGLNAVYKCKETRNYVVLRLRASMYTIAFLLVIILLLVLSVFGNTLSLFVESHIPLGRDVMSWLLKARGIINPVVLFMFSMLIYKFLPNNKKKWKVLIPGAMFTVMGWMAASFVFSTYLDVFKGFRSMYGSLTTIVLIMLWMYFCMYAILMGAELNFFLQIMDIYEDEVWLTMR